MSNYLRSNGSETGYTGFNLTNYVRYYVKTTFTLIPASSVGPVIINNLCDCTVRATTGRSNVTPALAHNRTT